MKANWRSEKNKTLKTLAASKEYINCKRDANLKPEQTSHWLTIR